MNRTMKKHEEQVRLWLDRSRESVRYFEHELASLDPNECPETLNGQHSWRDQDTDENRNWITVPTFCFWCKAVKEVPLERANNE